MASSNYSELNKKISNGCMAIIIIAIIIAIIYIMGSSGNSSSSSGNSSSSSGNSSSLSTDMTNKILAYLYAMDFVKKELKSPSTAKFPGTLEKIKNTTYLGNNTYKIVSWVDSQNSFGATLRTNFSCIIIIKADSDRCKALRFYK